MRSSATKNLACYCQSCGRTVSMNESFCTGCGAVLGDLQCPKCGYAGVTSEFENGCPKCLYLNPKGNRSSGILHLDTLKSASGGTSKSPKTPEIKKGSADSRVSHKRRRGSRPVKATEFPFMTNVFILIFLSFGLIGGFWWIHQ